MDNKFLEIFMYLITYQEVFKYYQGNFKGESAVAAILPSRMDASYCTYFFVAKPAKQFR